MVTGLMPSGNGYFVTLDKYLVDAVVRLDGIGAAIGRKGDLNSRGDRGGAGRATLHAPNGRLMTAGSRRSIGIGDAPAGQPNTSAKNAVVRAQERASACAL